MARFIEDGSRTQSALFLVVPGLIKAIDTLSLVLNALVLRFKPFTRRFSSFMALDSVEEKIFHKATGWSGIYFIGIDN